ncbi:MAG: hypothetical protein J7499_07170 [Sphingopyxis sp.]|nr:hypothetical protein [Sphingopyxis sp.]
MDDDLRILKRSALPAALETLDDRVLALLARRLRENSAARRMMALAVFLSLGSGIVAGSAIAPPAAVSPITPLVPAGPLLPSGFGDSS